MKDVNKNTKAKISVFKVFKPVFTHFFLINRIKKREVAFIK